MTRRKSNEIQTRSGLAGPFLNQRPNRSVRLLRAPGPITIPARGAMRTVFLMATTRCNNRCGFCFNREAPDLVRPVDLAAHAVPRYAADLAALGFTHVIVTGGEPLLHPGIDRILETIGERADLVEMITNGTRLTGDRARELSECFAGTLIWSLNDVHNRPLTPAAFLAETRARMADLCRVLPSQLAAIFVFAKETVDLIPAVVALCENAGVGLIVQPACLPLNSPDRATFSPLTLPRAEWERAIAHLAPWARRAGAARYLGYLQGLFDGAGLRPTTCGMGDAACVVDADGSVFACFHRRDLPAGRLGVDPPRRIAELLAAAHREVRDARCFGEHCVSLFVG